MFHYYYYYYSVFLSLFPSFSVSLSLYRIIHNCLIQRIQALDKALLINFACTIDTNLQSQLNFLQGKIRSQNCLNPVYTLIIIGVYINVVRKKLKLGVHYIYKSLLFILTISFSSIILLILTTLCICACFYKKT